MIKKLKLDVLGKSSPRHLRSGRQLSPVNSEKDETSKFFETKDLENHEIKASKIEIKEGNFSKGEEQIDVDKHKNVKKGKQVKKEKQVKVEDQNVETKTQIKIEKNETWFPNNWELVLNNIQEMRKEGTAPVDDMGCHKCADETASPKVFRYQSLLSLMLSSQTKDQVTHAAMQRLRETNCTPENILSLSNEELGKIIYPVGFWKVRNLI